MNLFIQMQICVFFHGEALTFLEWVQNNLNNQNWQVSHSFQLCTFI